jgi:hypothetical protein
MSESEWIPWSGGAVPVEGTDAKGHIQFVGETRLEAEKCPLSTLNYWPWFGEDERPCVLAYRIVDPAK